jgi:hypothetical protein
VSTSIVVTCHLVATFVQTTLMNHPTCLQQEEEYVIKNQRKLKRGTDREHVSTTLVADR